MHKSTHLLLMLLLAIATLGSGTTLRAAASPAAEGDITTDTTWARANSPYTVNDVAVQPGVTLTIEPGVEVRFAANTGLTVRGTLHAQGTAEEPIRFTGATEMPGSWRGIDFAGSAAATLTGSILDHVIVEYGGLPFSTGANLHLQHADIAIAHSMIRSGLRAGIYAEAGGVAHISDTAITANQGDAVTFVDGAVNPRLARLSVSGNGSDTIGMGSGTMIGEHTWEAAGAPYRALPGNTLLEIAAGATLTIEPGVTVLFDDNARLRVAGVLKAEGTSDRPITLTAASQQSGSWQGIEVSGANTRPAAAIMRYVTVEYGGIKTTNGANIYVSHGQLLMEHSIVRNGPANGIMLGQDGANSKIETTQFDDNASYSVYNIQPERPALAANNWWGAANGPSADNGCANGSGGKVSAGVVVTPYLSGPDAAPDAIPASDARLLSLTPQRWFAAADGVTRVWIEITLRDGAGNPLAGRTVKLQSSLGKIVDGGVTDVQGHTFAYLTSQSAGDATISALLDQTANCEFARSATATVTFTPDSADDEHAPSVAPYMNGNITAAPLPLTRGVPTTLSATVTNPGDAALSVEGSFGYAQSGIGLTFGPLGQPQQLTIAPHSSATFSTLFTPPLEGHYCFVFDYTYNLANATRTTATPMAAGSGHMQINLNFSSSAGRFPHFLDGVNPGPERPPWHPDEGIDASLSHFWRNLFSNLSLTGQNYQNNNSSPPLNRWSDSHPFAAPKLRATNVAATAATEPDYRQVSAPRQLSLPARQPGNGVSAARAAAENTGTEAMVTALVNLEAATTASQRYHSAIGANDLQWASIQASAADFYARAAGSALNASADAMEAYVNVLHSEQIAALPISVADVRAYQERLRAQGFSADDLSEMRLIGMDDATIEAERQGVIALAPERMAGDVLVRLGQLATAYRGMALDLRGGAHFDASHSAQTSTTANADAGSSQRLARAGEIQETIQIGNPFASAATIDLHVRPIDLPPDWIVSLSSSSLTLAPGEQQPVTVTIVPGTAIQGSVAQVAVEGYAADKLIDGVAFNVPVPEQRAFEKPFAVHLPLMVR
ncbi:MAG TPA: Ig-like domain-containing protein [Roseiflexaceae bacterium]|nr:Ig-like domain-containing protein [Roseiflexaceae bacterium]